VSVQLAAVVNGERVVASVADDQLLCDFLRDEMELLGTHVGCLEGVCGSCTVLVDGRQVRSCLLLAAQVDGCSVLTVEGLAAPGSLHPLQRAFIESGAIQCGFCTSGMLMASKALLDEYPVPSEQQIREALAGNLCRCTGYGKIVEAVLSAATKIESKPA
jgi:aerobic carbon-monoxide dehydrogenase small subunit